MISKEFYEKLMKITRVMQEKGGGITYIKNERDIYTLGTYIYSEEIAMYLNETLDSWEGCEAHVKKKKRGKTIKGNKVGYLWKIPINH